MVPDLRVQRARPFVSPLAIAAAGFAAALLLGACGKNEQDPAKKGPPAMALPVTVVQVKAQRVPTVTEAVGQTEGSREVEIRARVSGIVQKRLYQEGDSVRAGAVLFLIDRAPYEIALDQAKAALGQEKARIEQSQREATRMKELAAEQAISQKEYDDATSTLKLSEASVKAAEAKVREAELNLSYVEVTAPIGGVTGRALRSEGSLVTAGTDSAMLTTVAQTDPIWVRFSFSEFEYTQLRNASKKSEVKLVLPDGKMFAAPGKVNFTASTVDTKLGTVQLRAEFANPGLVLLPGQFVRVQVRSGEQDAFLVPQAALTQNDQGRFVWIAGPDGKAAMRPVEASAWSNNDWVVRSGLADGDQVITDNLLKLRPGAPVQPHPPGAPPAGAPQPAGKPAASAPKKPAERNAMSRFFIERPIFACVIAIIIVLAGLVSAKILPIAQYPEIAPPTVTITASYPGASAETLAKTVAAPIEEQLSGVEHMLYFNSSSASNGVTTITATFEVGTDIDKATFNVNNRVQLATPRLPDEVRRNGVTVAKRSQNFLLVISLNSPKSTHDTLFLSNYATVNVIDDIKRIAGVADVVNFAARDYSMRIWLKPDRMAQLGITTTDIQAVIGAQNAQYAAGKIGAEPAPKGQVLVYTVTARGRLIEAEEFGEIVLRSGSSAANGSAGVLRLKDVARIELGAQNYDASSTINGQPAMPLGVFLQSGANALDVAKAVKDKMTELKRERFPNDVDYSIPYDTTRFVSASIKEVVHTILEAAIIVVLVVFVFLQTWRATLIPMLAVPVSLIGTFAGLWLFDFSINTLTLFAMVLAIGIVVDDAIVVLENVERLMREEKMKPFDAAIEAMREVQGAVIGIVLALCAVFIPVAFLGGIAGQLYRQFAVTVAIAVVLSGVTALTLTPALCAILLKESDHTGGWFDRPFRWFNRGFDWTTRHFLGAVDLALARRVAALIAYLLVIGLVGLLLWRTPGSFVPPEDQGYIIAAVMLPDGATLERTSKTTEQLRGMMKDNEAIENFFIVNGFDLIGGGNKGNAATIFAPMKPWDQRKQTSLELANEVSGKGFMLSDGIAFAFNPPAIQGLGAAGGFEVYVQGRTEADPQKLAQVTNDFIAALNKHPALTGINTFFRPTVPQLRVEVDREKALALGVPVSDVFIALQAQMGSLYVNDFNRSGRIYRVTIQADAPYRAKPEDLGSVYVRSATNGSMIPLKALIKIDNIIGPEQIERYNTYIAAKVLGNAKPGYSSGEAIAAVEEVAKATLPQSYSIEWTGQAFQEKRTGSASIFAFGFAIVMVYLILSALYERWGVPLAVVLAVPFALLGALGFVWLRDMNNDIYFQIGLIVLIGLAAKNAILIAEFAMQGMEQGKTAAEAAREAARLRFRPIVMTSLAFVFGVLPLVIATGAGAAARQSMGTGVFGGMVVATFVAPIFVPLFFALLARKPRPSHKHEAPHPVVSPEKPL